MNENKQMIKVADDLYDNLAMKVKEMYIVVGNELEDKASYEEVITEYDQYMQNLLFLMAIADNNFVDNELSFLQNVYWIKTSFESFFIENYNLLSDELKIKIKKQLIEYLNNIPAFIKLSVLMDKHCDNLAIINKPTYCQIVFDNLLRLPIYLEFIDDNVVIEESEMEKVIMAPIRAYYESKHVKFARNRGEN